MFKTSLLYVYQILAFINFLINKNIIPNFWWNYYKFDFIIRIFILFYKLKAFVKNDLIIHNLLNLICFLNWEIFSLINKVQSVIVVLFSKVMSVN